MADKNTIRGEEVTERQIDEWVAEAEAGFDVAALKKRGRPARSREASQVVALRLTAEELAALDVRAQREGKSRSEVIRDALSESAA
jgi:predicted transcriptional regulator